MGLFYILVKMCFFPLLLPTVCFKSHAECQRRMDGTGYLVKSKSSPSTALHADTPCQSGVDSIC